MNHSREPDNGLDADTSERLLGGAETARADDRVADLAALLAVAAEPLVGRPEDERAALAHFRREYGAPVPLGRLGVLGRHRLKAAAAVAAVLTLGGVALAAQPQVFAHPFGSGKATPGPRPSVVRPTATPRPPRPTTASGRPTAPAGSATSTVTPSPRPAPPAPPSPSHVTPLPAATAAQPDMKGLCEAYVKAAQRGKSLNGASQARLDRAAGGSSHVDAYCAELLGTAAPFGSPHPAPTARPTPSGGRNG